MKNFVLKRFLQMALVWVLVSMFAFAIIYFAPGDPLYMYMTPGATGHKLTDAELQAMRESLGLTGNVFQQYAAWAQKMMNGNWGISIQTKDNVLDLILSKLPCTMGLMGASMVLSLIVAIPLGLIAGTHKNKLSDNIISAMTYVGVSMPAFWLGIMLVIIFSIWESGYGVRYCCDFAWQFILGGAAVLYLLYDRVAEGQGKTILRNAFTVAMVLGVVVGGAMLYEYLTKTGNLASHYLRFAKIFDFWM